MEAARSLPGFQDQPEAFVIDECIVDRDEWVEGFVVVSVPDH
jgi:hypothetical protein